MVKRLYNASECLTVKRNEKLREMLKFIIWEAIVELEKILFPLAFHVVSKIRVKTLKTSRIKECTEVEPLGEYFDILFSKLSIADETKLNYLLQPATMKLLEIRKVVPKK